jgi:hypothetical protein
VAKDLQRRTLQVDRRQAQLPVDTGRLRSSITWERWAPTAPRASNVVATSSGSSTVELRHPDYVELGTSKMAAQPYLLPALEAAK